MFYTHLMQGGVTCRRGYHEPRTATQMTANTVKESLIEALKQALAGPSEQPLYRAGKSAGLFPSRSDANEEAAMQALRGGLLEVVREETKGKTTIQWVRPTHRAVEVVYEHESPVRALHELRSVLQANQERMPLWLGEIRGLVQEMANHIRAETNRWTHIIESLGHRVGEAIRRAEAGEQATSNGDAGSPWLTEVLSYLDRRREAGAAADCPLPELFAAIRECCPDLTLKSFHEGLRRLQKRRALSLVPFSGPPNQLSQPEFALLDGADVLYYATR